MEQIKFTQTHTLSLARSTIGGSIDGPTSTPTTIDERLVAEEVLGVRR